MGSGLTGGRLRTGRGDDEASAGSFGGSAVVVVDEVAVLLPKTGGAEEVELLAELVSGCA